jgi:hypothetical protein
MSGGFGKAVLGDGEVGAAARRRLISDLTSQPDLNRLRGIASGVLPGKDLIRNTIWGEIRWSALLGRPSAPTLSAGFHVTYDVIERDAKQEGGAEEPFDLPARKPTPFMWDAAERDGELAVLLMAEGTPRAMNPRGFRVDNPNVFTVGFAPGVPFVGRSQLAPLGLTTVVPERQSVIFDDGDVAVVEFRVRNVRPGAGP